MDYFMVYTIYTLGDQVNRSHIIKSKKGIYAHIYQDTRVCILDY